MALYLFDCKIRYYDKNSKDKNKFSENKKYNGDANVKNRQFYLSILKPVFHEFPSFSRLQEFDYRIEKSIETIYSKKIWVNLDFWKLLIFRVIASVGNIGENIWAGKFLSVVFFILQVYRTVFP